MSTLADSNTQAACCDRLSRIRPDTSPKWGRMTAHQMVCHLDDSFRVATGDKYASPASNLFSRTVMKWVALRTAVPWPKGVKTRPEVDQAVGGTAPTDWAADCARLRRSITTFASVKSFHPHPLFGEMSQRDWMVWGYRHVDHHFRQFGV